MRMRWGEDERSFFVEKLVKRKTKEEVNKEISQQIMKRRLWQHPICFDKSVNSLHKMGMNDVNHQVIELNLGITTFLLNRKAQVRFWIFIELKTEKCFHFVLLFFLTTNALIRSRTLFCLVNELVGLIRTPVYPMLN